VTTAFASATDTADQKAKLVEFATDVYGYVSDFDPNVGLIVGDEACLVIDTRATPRMAREFLADISNVTSKPVRYVFLTHYHAVRVLGASAYNGAEIISSRDTLEMIRTTGQFDFEVEVRRFPRLFKGLEEIPGLTIPNVTFGREMSLWFGTREVRLLAAGRGHTAGDSICWLRGTACCLPVTCSNSGRHPTPAKASCRTGSFASTNSISWMQRWRCRAAAQPSLAPRS
jgi:glyoxylase-like metal-dependent hydrolase (beta-lactamase superfamily II)